MLVGLQDCVATKPSRQHHPMAPKGLINAPSITVANHFPSPGRGHPRTPSLEGFPTLLTSTSPRYPRLLTCLRSGKLRHFSTMALMLWFESLNIGASPFLS